MLGRRDFVMGAAAAVAGVTSLSAKPFEWVSAAPADAGFTPDIEARFDKLVAEKRAPGLHGVVVVRGRQIVLERYFEADDNNWGKRTHVKFGPGTLHNLYSVSKSVVALVYGVALAAKRVPPPDAPLYAQFPEYDDLVAADPRRKERTIAHALTMTLGLQWDEITVPYADPRNDEIAMEMSKDRYRFILARPVIGPPGRRWLYSGGATALLGRLIAKGTGQSLPDYAGAALFDPLGIGPVEWLTNKDTWVAASYGAGDGEPVAASGLRVTPRDLARIGQLVLDRGQANGRPVIPASWLDDCMTPRVSADEQRRYGYQWYVGDFEFRSQSAVRLEHWVGAFGNGGQRLFVLPDLDLVVAITAGNYGQPDQWRPPIRVMREVVLPSLL